MSIGQNIHQIANKFFLYRYFAYQVHRFVCIINPVREINRNYFAVYHRYPNLEEPHSLIEKICWMELHCDTSQWTLFADKYRMREYVEEKGYGQYLPTLYGVWEDPSQIDWDGLPSRFVMKTNNGCGTVLIVKNKRQHSLRKVKRLLREWLAIPYGYRGYQPHYLSIKPCVLAEELLSQDEYLNELSPTSMVDFKVWCFNGRVESIFVGYNRSESVLCCDLYDKDWNRIDHYLQTLGHYQVHHDVVFPRPQCLEEMKRIASNLSKGQPQMRVDFYIVNGRPILGELTMATGYGYFTDEYYDYLGTLTDLRLMKIKDEVSFPSI